MQYNFVYKLLNLCLLFVINYHLTSHDMNVLEGHLNNKRPSVFKCCTKLCPICFKANYQIPYYFDLKVLNCNIIFFAFVVQKQL